MRGGEIWEGGERERERGGRRVGEPLESRATTSSHFTYTDHDHDSTRTNDSHIVFGTDLESS